MVQYDQGDPMVKRLMLIFLLLLPLAGIVAETDLIGEVVFLSGEVRVVRDNRDLDFVDIGDQIENFDQIITGRNGNIEIAIYPETGIHASISIAPDSAIYFDISSLRPEQQGAVELITGRIDLTVGRLSGNNGLDVRTHSAILGVRGTVFSVTSTLGGDVLLTAREGRVECRTETNQILYAVPGEVVEKAGEERWRNLSVNPEMLDRFREDWFSERLAILDANASRAIVSYANRYLDLKEDFVQAYVRLMNNRDVIQKWMDEDRLGTVGSTADRLREKRQIIGSLLNVRMRLFQFERVYARLSRLVERYPDIPGDTQITAGLNYRNFLRQFAQDAPVIEQRMREIRYVVKLYSLRNEGLSPFELFDGILSGSDGFFGRERDFFGD
jgi:hypothetical protein